MTDEQFNKLFQLFSNTFGAMNARLNGLAEHLGGIEASLAQIVSAQNPSPNYTRHINEFLTFDWLTINARVTETDDDGPAVVEWQNKLFKRRAGNPTFGENVVYFSRAVGKDDSGQNRYERLITFKEMGEARELSRKTQKTVQAAVEAKKGDSGKLQNGQGKRPGQPQRQFACQPALVTALTKKNEACATLGIRPDKWKASLKASELSSDDVRAFTDDQMRRALEIIEDLIVAEQERRAVAEEGEDFSPNF